MGFIQIVDFRTDDIDEGRKHVDEYRAKTEGRRTARRSVLCRDRDDPGHYLNIVFFDSYDAAMENSAMPETAELSENLASLMTQPPTFLNLEVEWDEDES